MFDRSPGISAHILEQFERRNGNPPHAYDADAGVSYYKNGGSYSDTNFFIDGDGVTAFGAENPLSLREENRWRYYAVRHKNAVRDFRVLKTELSVGRNPFGYDWDKAHAELERLRDAARKAAADLETAEAARLENDPEYAAQRRRVESAERFKIEESARIADHAARAARMEI